MELDFEVILNDGKIKEFEAKLQEIFPELVIKGTFDPLKILEAMKDEYMTLNKALLNELERILQIVNSATRNTECTTFFITGTKMEIAQVVITFTDEDEYQEKTFELKISNQ